MRAALAAACLLPLAGCAVLSPRPVIEKRFAAQSDGGNTATGIEISVTSADIADASTSIALTALSDRGQAALIEQTKGKPPVTIETSDKSVSGATALADTIHRRLVVAIRPVTFLGAGDRVDAVRIKLEVAPAQSDRWRVASWTQASNGQTTIDIGKLTDSSSTKLTASAGLGVLPLPTVTVGGEAERSRTRELEIKDTTDFDAAVDDKGHAWLDETAGWRTSLAHTLSMDITVVTPLANTQAMYLVAASPLAKDERPAPAAAVRLHETAVYSPSSAREPICGHAELTYRIRHITNPAGRATFTEADDDVAFVTGTSEAGFLLAPAPYSPVYGVVVGGHALHYAMANAGPAELVFASLEEATAFRDWYRTVSPPGGRIGNATIGIDIGGDLRPVEAADLPRLMPHVANEAAPPAAARGCPVK